MIKIDYFLLLLGSCERVANFREAKPLHAKLARLRSYAPETPQRAHSFLRVLCDRCVGEAKTYTWVLDRG